MAEGPNVQTTPRSPYRWTKEERQQRIPRPSRPDRAPRRLSPPKKSTARQPTESPPPPPVPRDPKRDDIGTTPQFQSTSNPSTRDQGPSQPCLRLRHLATVDGGAALQRLYAVIQRQRDEWYQSNYASASPASAMATPQHDTNTPTTQPIDDQGRTFATPGGVAWLAAVDYTEPSRVTTPFTASGVSEFSRGQILNDQGPATMASRQVTPAGLGRESQSLRFKAPFARPSDPTSAQTSDLGVIRDGGLPSDNRPAPFQESSARTLDSTALKQTGQDISGGTLEASSPRRQGQDISGGILEASSPRGQGQDISGGILESSPTQPQGQDVSGATGQSPSVPRRLSGGQVTTAETGQFGSSQRLGQDAKEETTKADSLHQLGWADPADSTQRTSTRQTGMPGAAVEQHPRGTSASAQAGIQQTDTPPQPQTSIQPLGGGRSGCSCGHLANQFLPQRDFQQPAMVPAQNPSLQQSSTQPCDKLPFDCPPSRITSFQTPLGSPRPEVHHSDVSGTAPPRPSSNRDWSQQSTGGTGMQAPAESLQHIVSPQSPRAPSMQVTSGLSREFPLSPRPAESGSQVPDRDSLKVTNIPESPHQEQSSTSPTKRESVGEELRGHESESRPQTFGNQIAAEAQAKVNLPTFEEQVSSEFQILRELALSLKNLRHVPAAVPPPLGTAFENCVLAEIRSIRSRCTGYTQSGICNQASDFSEGTGSRGPLSGPQGQPPEPQESDQGRRLPDSNQVSAFEHKVIAVLRSINRVCDAGTSAQVDQPSPVTDIATDQRPSSTTRLFEELVLHRLNELGKEFGCKQATQPALEPIQKSHPNPEDVQPTTSDTRNASGARDSHPSPPQATSNQPDEESPQSKDPRDRESLSRRSGVDSNDQPTEPSNIRDSSQPATPSTRRRFGSQTFDTTTSSPTGTNGTDQSRDKNAVVQSQVEPGKDETPTVEDQSRRDTLDGSVPSKQSGENDSQDLGQRQSRPADEPRNTRGGVTWAVNCDPTFQRVSTAPQKSGQAQETIYMRPTVVPQRFFLRPSADNGDERLTDDCETGSMCDSDSDEDSTDSCSPRRLTFSHPLCASPRERLNAKRMSNQTYLDCDYTYRASELAALNESRQLQRLSMPVTRPSWRIGGPSGVVPADLTQYTMSETQSSQSPRADSHSVTAPGSAYTRPSTSMRPTGATIPLSSTLKEGHTQPLPSELPSMIQSERHRSTSTQEALSRGIHDGVHGGLQATSFAQSYGGSLSSQRPPPLETGQGPRGSFNCSDIYYEVAASNAPLVQSRHRAGFASSGVCDQLDEDSAAAEESLCWDDGPNVSLRPGFSPTAAAARNEFDCTNMSGFQRRRPNATSLECEGLLRKEGAATPWPCPIGAARNRWPPLRALDCSGERLRPTTKTLTADPCSRRRSSRRGRRSIGKTSGVRRDSRCRSTKVQLTKRTALTSRVANCMGVAPSRPRYAAADPCTSSESETDGCEF